MKKLICLILIFVLILPACVMADSIDQLIADYNLLSENTTAFKLSKAIMTEKDGSISFQNGTTSVVFMRNADGDFKTAAVYAETFEPMISCSALAGLYVVQSSEEYIGFLGWLNYMYFWVNRGKEPFHKQYGDYTFSIEKKGNGFFFMIMKL